MVRHLSRCQSVLQVLMAVALIVGLIGNALPVDAAMPQSNQSASANLDRSTPPDRPAAPTASGAAMYLNGTNYVTIPNASFPVIGSNDFSLEAWIYPTNVTGFHAVLAKQYNAGFWFGLYNGKLRFYRGSTTYVESVTTIPINRWTHIAVAS